MLSNHAILQAAFPALPRYTAPSSIVHLPRCEESVAGTTRKVLAELNKTYEEAFGQSFMEAAVQYCSCRKVLTSESQSRKRRRRYVQCSRNSVIQSVNSTQTLRLSHFFNFFNFCQGWSSVTFLVTFLPM